MIKHAKNECKNEDECQEHCRHVDRDSHMCLTCGLDLAEHDIARAEYLVETRQYDLVPDRTKRKGDHVK